MPFSYPRMNSKPATQTNTHSSIILLLPQHTFLADTKRRSTTISQDSFAIMNVDKAAVEYLEKCGLAEVIQKMANEKPEDPLKFLVGNIEAPCW